MLTGHQVDMNVDALQSRVNPTLDEMNNAFEEFSRVVKARPSFTTAALVEGIRHELICLVNVITMQMNTGNVNGLMNQLHGAQILTRNIVAVTRRVRQEHGIRGFHVKM
ncbi:hypothetical protein CRE_07462 [Caenorhabditis remanei]|uniref:Uncharacterized protein n=1 Tax=Caenorhabditis remanei TaxID=31234 RepID=E3M2P0_CAERE|nr:hypothetical protein CRE_07462 [Caenorhabditis remanei]